MTNQIPRMVDVLTESAFGSAKLSFYTPTGLDIMRSQWKDQWASLKPVACLTVNGVLVMSDGDDERRSNWDICHHASGHTLIAGLGIGMVLTAAVPKSDSVTVVEVNEDVIALIEPQIRQYLGPEQASKLNIIHADIMDWKPPKGTKYDAIYFDIWNDICTDNLSQIAQLHQRFKFRKVSRDSFMESWQQDNLRYMQQTGG